MAVTCVQSASREVGKGDARRACVCGEQTANIPAMLVTLDVSKFSGWLNADAPRFTPWLGLGYIGLGLGLGLELWFMVRFGGVRVRVRVIGSG